MRNRDDGRSRLGLIHLGMVVEWAEYLLVVGILTPFVSHLASKLALAGRSNPSFLHS